MAGSGTPALRLLPACAPAQEPDREVCWEGPLPHARPGERCEPWPLPPRLAKPLHDAASAARVERSLAASVLVQRRLALLDLPGHAAERLDAAARRAGPSVCLTEPSRAYLRALMGAGEKAISVSGAPVMLPMRLSERVLAHGIATLLDPPRLRAALAWERAALCAGRTIGEWALLEARPGAPGA